MVADANDTENFSQDSLTVQSRLPATMQATDVFTSTVGTTAAQGDILERDQLGSGARELPRPRFRRSMVGLKYF